MLKLERKFNSIFTTFSFYLIFCIANIYVCAYCTYILINKFIKLTDVDCAYFILFSITFLLVLFINQLIILRFLPFIRKFIHIDTSSIKILMYLFYFLSSVMFVIIIGIKDSFFEYYCLNQTNFITNEIKIDLKLMYDIALSTIQATAIVLSYGTSRLYQVMKSINNRN